jgi:hypothetical protein
MGFGAITAAGAADFQSVNVFALFMPHFTAPAEMY